MATNLDVKGMSDVITGTIDSLGDIDMGGVKLNQPTKELLELDELTLDVHVAMHPAAIAYYGALKKEAARNLGNIKKAYERWERQRYSEARVKVTGSSTAQHKPTQNDIEARMVVDNIKEMEAWDERLDEAQKHLDTLESWFEAWRQKSFALRDHVQMDEEERYNAGGGSMTRKAGGERPALPPDKMGKIKDIIRRRRESQTGVQS